MFRPQLESEVVERLRDQAAQAGFPLGTYMERVVGLAHGFSSPFLPPADRPLPVVVGEAELQRHVDSLSATDCTPSLGGVFALFRVDEALGLRVQQWCDERDVAYSSYIRSVLRLAAGYRSADDLTPRHIQDSLPDVASYGGERARAS